MRLRPMRAEDVPAVHLLNVETFEALSRANHQPLEPRPDPELASVRYRHLVRTDPEGAWVAEHEGEIAGCALALKREGVWGLSLLVVRPDLQSGGLGRELLARTNEYAAGARARIVLSSEDPRAMRAYARIGLTLHPTLWARGVAHGVRAPAGVRAGDTADIPLIAAVDRRIRGAAHGPDIDAQLEMGQTLLIAPERGYAIVSAAGEVRMLAALDDDTARDLLRAALAHAGEHEATVAFLTSAQQWAIEVVVAARLELRADGGCLCVDGDLGPMTPYLPSGAFL
jgi:GNAT superfamily N-acetyltransferase